MPGGPPAEPVGAEVDPSSIASCEVTRERDEYLDALQRLKAEFDNYRKRVARDQADLVARASERLVKQLLPVLDDLERALEAAADARGGAARGRRPARPPRARRRARARGPRRGRDRRRVRPAHAGGAARRSRPRRTRAPSSRCCRRATGSATACSGPRAWSSSAGGAAAGVAWLARSTSRSASRRTRRRTRSRRRTASSRASTTRTRTPATTAAEARFKEVQHAYDVLSDPEKRKQYDRFGRANGRPGPGPTNVDFGDFDLGDIFGGLFGGGGGRGSSSSRSAASAARRRGRGAHLVRGLAARASQTTVPVELELACHTCHGTGAAPGTAPKRCPQCDGSGVVATSQGLFALQQPCPRCRGNGHDRRDAVPDLPRHRPRAADEALHGPDPGRRQGRHEDQAEGQGRGRLRRRARPATSSSSRASSRRSSTSAAATTSCSTCRSRSTRPRSAATVEIPTPDGRVSLKVPAGSQDGKLLRVKGRGAPRLKGGGRGDLLARVRVEVPAKLTKAQREALEEFQKATTTNPRERLFGVSDERTLAEDADGRAAALHDLGRRRARRHAPADARIYEQKGLVRPQRTAGNTRLYSDADVERLRLIQRLTTELGLNLARRRAACSHLEDELAAHAAAGSTGWSARCASDRPGAPAVPPRPRPLPAAQPPDRTSGDGAGRQRQTPDVVTTEPPR